MDTKEKILDAAEKLFAEKGFASTSMRDITAEAGVNLAAVNYHFGSKLALLNAVFARRFVPVNEERLELLEACDTTNAEDVLRAFVAPLVKRLRERDSGWEKFLQLVGRTHSDTNEEIRACLHDQLQVIAQRFSAAFGNACPELPPGVLVSRIHFIVGAMAHTLAFCRHKNMPLSEALPEPEAILENLVDFAVAGLRAPVRTAGSLQPARRRADAGGRAAPRHKVMD